MTTLLTNFVALFIESAPWLLLGLMIAGLMKWLVPMALLNKQLGQSNLTSVVKAAFIGAPLPLCSCGVIPAAIGLRRSGASKSASVSFLVATPETGVDSVSVSYALLGPFMAIIRPVAAIMSAIYAGLLVMFVTRNEKQQPGPSSHATSCCQSERSCSSDKSETPSLTQRIVNSLSFASGKLLMDITRWLLIGLVLAAAIRTWVPMDFLVNWGDGLLAMIVMALIGIPMYICATASTPIAAGFLAAGVSPGAILVFMLAGPATNLSTMGMIRQEMGNSVLTAYLISILSASIGFGYLVNWAIAHFGFEVYSAVAHSHAMNESILHQMSAILLACLMLRNIFKHHWSNIREFLRKSDNSPKAS
ncbi:permease [Aliikangiella marina]|uniref:Permease n=1 Tax=Aliikangiella marina TaxID=1712262 RepID=A0A545T8W3_9GAMM|nr:SO_0444 family Cu/Zn efflux transporter [Aliikangiella marina]TQV73656.1 permease [Aliikangiella marina]